MSEPSKIIPLRQHDDDARLIVTLTVGELQKIISDIVQRQTASRDSEGLMDVPDVAAYIKQSEDFVYRHWKQMNGRLATLRPR